MSDLSLMLKAIEFIETHLTEAVTIADVAEAVSFSLFHFSRTFSRVTRHAPYDYLMRRRLSEAALRLLETDEKVIDIAFRYQFNAPETFSRAFKRMFNRTPRHTKLPPGFDKRRLLPRLSADYLDYINSNAALTPSPQKMPALRLAGLATPLNLQSPELEAEKQALWQLLAQETPLPGDCYGLLMTLPSRPDTHCLYLAGIPVTAGDETTPSFFVRKTLTPSPCACFRLLPQTNAARFTRSYIYHTWQPRAGGNFTPAVFEVEHFTGPDTPLWPDALWIPQ